MSTTPPDSGRTSPALRPPRRPLEDESRKNDKNFRKWGGGIERALATFDPARLEWPDYISFLGRLLKAIQGHPPGVDSLPHKVAVAHHLAQSLRPSLPSGVHQKALGVYDCIFSLIGPKALANDLTVYLPGLTAVLGFASLSLRPTYLSLIETHIITLNGNHLRPAVRALILSLLPGLEEESGEDFDRTLHILDQLKEAVNVETASESSGDESFWQCFFLACISSASRRQGALAYLIKRLPQLVISGGTSQPRPKDEGDEKPMAATDETLSPAAESVVSPEPGLLIRCFISGLEDEQLLTQRGFLDLLLTHLPLNSPVLVRRTSASDLSRLVGAATTVVARRDMSLNRRLWSWFLGPEVGEDNEESEDLTSQVTATAVGGPTKSKTCSYFETYGATPIIKSVLSLLQRRSPEPVQRARPFRICLSLMDRAEIGSTIVPHVFLPAIINIYEYKGAATEQDFQDVLRSASTFFDGIDSGTIWGQITEVVLSSFSGEDANIAACLHNIDLAEFMLMNFNVREQEMLAIHIPLLILLLISLIGGEELDSSTRTDQHIQLDRNARAYSLVETLLASLSTDSAWSSPSLHNGEPEPEVESRSEKQLVESIIAFYRTGKGEPSLLTLYLPERQIGRLVLTASVGLVTRALSMKLTPASIEPPCRILISLLSRLSLPSDTDLAGVVTAMRGAFAAKDPGGNGHHADISNVSFHSVSAVISVLKAIASTSPDASWWGEEDFADTCANLSGCLWDQLAPSSPRYHLEAVRCIWQLEELLPRAHSVEASIISLLVRSKTRSPGSSPIIEQARRFAVLWNHTNVPSVGQGRRNNSVWSKSFAAAVDSHFVHGSGNMQGKLYRPLFVLLDACDEGDSELRVFLDSWIDGLPGASRIFSYLVSQLRTMYARSTKPEGQEVGTPGQPQRLHQDQNAECLYLMRRLSSLLRPGSERTWSALLVHDPALAGNGEDRSDDKTLLYDLADLTFVVASSVVDKESSDFSINTRFLQQASISLLQSILSCQHAHTLQILKLEERLVGLIRGGLKSRTLTPSVQASLLDTTLVALKTKDQKRTAAPRQRSHRRLSSIDHLSVVQQNDSASDHTRQDELLDPSFCSELVKCLQEGFESPSSVNALENWVGFFIEVLPLLSASLFQTIIPLVDALCRRIRELFEDLSAGFETDAPGGSGSPEPALNALLNGLECLLDMGHERMISEESKRAPQRGAEPPQGFFGTVVSGVFAGDTSKLRPSGANIRLTVVLCFQDALRICLSIWSWGAYGGKPRPQDPHCLASFSYVSQRLRSKTRRMLDGMFNREGLECLEALIVTWTQEQRAGGGKQRSTVISLLHVLDASTPKLTMPGLFNSIYSRTSPASIEPSRMSTLTSDLTDIDLALFLLEYTKSLDDDAMDEIWTDCMTFLRDVLLNPLPQNHILPSLLEFLIVLAHKVDKTNFGDQRKMRRELADIFLRLLTATFTTRGTTQPETQLQDEYQSADGAGTKGRPNRRKARQTDLSSVLTTIIPRLPTVLADNDRLIVAVTSISANYITPLLHSKIFPQNLRPEQVHVWQSLTKLTHASKVWRKDLSDLFMHPKFFSISPSFADQNLSPLMHQLAMQDKDRVSELLSRINPPTSAGIMFGVGATAARTEADKKTQLLLRRASFLVLSAEEDYAVTSMGVIETKISELLNATAASSPSSATRAEVFMLISALALRTSQIHLAPLWPLITNELQKAIASAIPRSPDFETYNVPSLLQACKLLDLFLVVNPDEFQLHEWLFVTDTIEAVYRPGHWEPVALLDDLADELGGALDPVPAPAAAAPVAGEAAAEDLRCRQPLLRTTDAVAGMSKDEFVGKLLRPFFAQLSMYAYEATYAMKGPDLGFCRVRLVKDLFDDSTIIG